MYRMTPAGGLLIAIGGALSIWGAVALLLFFCWRP
jgi:hypothetical protein